MSRADLTPGFVRKYLVWDPLTGKLFRKRRDYRERRGTVGREAGSIYKSGNTFYRRVSVGGKGVHATHNLIWLLAYGHWPAEIDHGDGNGLNNKLGNLTDGGRSGNAKNRARYKSNMSGQTGVRWLRHASRWQATIRSDGKTHNLGCFASIEGAISARKLSELRFGFHPNHGRSPA